MSDHAADSKDGHNSKRLKRDRSGSESMEDVEHKRVLNFNAGPAGLPVEVLERAKSELLNWNGCGMSVMEMSHRSKEFMSILNQTISDIRDLLCARNLHSKLGSSVCRAVPKNYKILLMQGGATGQFAAVPLNLLGEHKTVDYVVTGGWSEAAAKEAGKYANVNVVASTASSKYTSIPAESTWKRSEKPAYLYYCANETVHGVEFPFVPEAGETLLVADFSSNFMSKPIDISKFALVYAGVQKNAGPAGLTVVIIREDLLKIPAQKTTPIILNYKDTFDKDSMYNTPPCYTIYMVGLVMQWLKSQGGLTEIDKRSKQKADIIYHAIDHSHGFYTCPVDKSCRSRMNVRFNIAGGAALEKAFVEESTKAGLIGLEGHRSAGGLRASLYNAVTVDNAKTLAEFMTSFQAAHSKK